MQHTNRPRRDVRRVVFALAILAAFGLLAANGCPPQTIQETKLLASDGAAGDLLGASVSISGDVAVVGAPGDETSGSAYVYRFDGTNWVEEAKLLASDGEAGDRFGGITDLEGGCTGVSVSGDIAVVGADGDDDNGSESGSAYVFRFDGTDWVEEAKLVASDGTAGKRFGWSISVSGAVAVIGTRRAASAYVYRFDGMNWIEEAKLLVGGGGGNSGRVSISGELIVMGDNRDDDNGDFSGSAYVYRFDGTSWVEQVKLLASDGASGDYFGYSVSVSGAVVVVGASADSDIGRWFGSAYVFRFDGTDWVEEAKLVASDGAFADGFGSSVSVSGDVTVIGTSIGTPGSAYVFRFDGTDWVEHAKLLASDGGDPSGHPIIMGDFFGNKVSVSGDVVVVGAVGNNDYGEDSGSAYVFSPLSGIPACSDGIDNDGDGLADLEDPGCSMVLDTSEHWGLVICDDGLDNDADGYTDYPSDPACEDVLSSAEQSTCQDGIDGDNDGLIDFDGGQSIHGACSGGACPLGVSDPDGDGVADPDPQCAGQPWRNGEGAVVCGLGFELALILPGLMWLHRRRRRLH